MILICPLIIAVLVLLLYDYRSGIVTVLMVITNFGEFVYVNPNLEIGDFGGIGKIFFMDLFWVALMVVIFIKRKNLYLLNYKISFIFLFVLFIISLIIPFLISSFTIKDTISVIRPLGNFLYLPYLVLNVTGLKAFNFLEKTITTLVFIFIIVQVFEYILQKRIPIRLFESYSIFYGEDPYAVEFGGIKTGYIWSRIGYLLPFNLFFGCYYYFSRKKNYGLFLITLYILSIMISLSRIWIIGFAFFLIAITFFLISWKENKQSVLLKLFSLIASLGVLGIVLLYTSSTFGEIFNIFLLRVNSINDLADKTDSSYFVREIILFQMFNIWKEYPFFGAGFSSISRKLVSNDLGIPNIITIFGASGIIMLGVFIKQFFSIITQFVKSDYILFASLASVMIMISAMSLFSIDMFYFNATGAIMFAFGNILLNIAKHEPEEEGVYAHSN